MANWYQLLAHHFRFPADYTVIDLETNGLQPDQCEICVIGHTVVRNDVPVEIKETYINWWLDPAVDHAAIEKRLLDTQAHMEGHKKAFLHTKEKLLAEGWDPAYGARPMRRAIQRLIQDPLALRLLEGDFADGDTVKVDAGEAGAMIFSKIPAPVEEPVLV